MDVKSGIFEGQTHVVVGAASGIGQAAAMHLAGQGAEVVCLDLDAAGAAVTAKSIVTASQTAATSDRIDVSDHDSVQGAFAPFRAGKIDVLVNCAGITGKTGIKSQDVDMDDFDRVYAVNLRGALLVSQAVLPIMLGHDYGRIIHLASISGKEGNAGQAAYSSTKAGLIGLVKVMGKEYATSGITINALAPAVIRTPILDTMPDSQIEYMTSKIPMERTGTLEEAVNMISWVVSPQCSFVTGFTFDLSGGRAVY